MPFGRYCPFLLESDTLSLSSSAELGTGLVYDVALGATHTVREPGVHILQALREGVTLRELDDVANKHTLHNGQLAELLGFLNLAGMLVRQRPLHRQPEALLRQAWQLCLSIRYAPLAWRRIATPVSIAVAIIRATALVVAATAVVCVLIIVTGLSMPMVFGTGAFGLLLFLGSLYLHEVAHITIIKRYGHKPVVLQRGLRLGILHPPLATSDEISCSLAGPFAGAASALSVGAAAFSGQRPSLGLLSVVVASFHALSLLPWYGDGASIRHALQKKRSL